jgi:hypothetical protein
VLAQAWVRAIDAHYALGQFAEAAEALAQAQARCPGFKDIPEYKVGLVVARAACLRCALLHGKGLGCGVLCCTCQLSCGPCSAQAIAAAVSKAVGKPVRVAA